MPDMGWTDRQAGFDKAKWLESLTVQKTVDEFGNPRYFITDWNGDWIGDAFETAEFAFDEIDKMRRSDA